MDNPVPMILDKAQEISFSYKIGNVYFAPTYLQAIAIIFLLFLLVLSIARLRRLYIDWSLKGSLSMMGLGFFLALILEGFLLLGGKTALTEVLGWKSAPKPISNVLDLGRERLTEVLGVDSEIPSGRAKEPPTAQELLEVIDLLPDKEYEELRNSICR